MKTSSNSISNRQKIPIPNPRQALSSNGESTGFTTSDDEDTGDNWDNDSTEGEFDDEEVSNRVDEEVFLDSAEFVDTSSQAQRIERRDESYYTALGSPVTTPTVEDDSNFLKVEKDQVMMQE